MFPGKPATPHTFNDTYANQLPDLPSITEKQIQCHLDRLSPHKAPGPDDIPNVVLKKCTDILVPYLLQIFRVSLGLQCYPEQWKDSITCVIWKPGKPRYDVPKAYQPIALVNTIAKLLYSIVTEDISCLTEKHQLLPANHFGGSPGWCTADSLHLLMDTVKAAWCRKQVVSVLFLNVEGAFPNAIMEQLLHNLRKWRVPEMYVVFICNMLTLHRMKLKFDDHTPSWFTLDNGISQGDPLSMILYLYYNADILDVAHGQHELGLGYIDDMAFMVAAKMFHEAHCILGNMMTRPEGGNAWSLSHNSRFEASKSILVDFSCSNGIEHPPMWLGGAHITPQPAHKFLSIMLDQELQWSQQANSALAKSTKWTLAFWGLAKSFSGVNL